MARLADSVVKKEDPVHHIFSVAMKIETKSNHAANLGKRVVRVEGIF